MIGGYLAQPASKFGPLQKPFFCKYPYSLPCIVGGGLAVIGFIGTNMNTEWLTRQIYMTLCSTVVVSQLLTAVKDMWVSPKHVCMRESLVIVEELA